MSALVQGDNFGFKEQLNKLTGNLEELLDLLKVYLKFSVGFTRNHRPYYSYLVDDKVCACLLAVREFISYQANTKIVADKNIA